MTPSEFDSEILSHITFADILRAAGDELDQLPLERFRDASDWVLMIAGEPFAHRRVIARAAASRIGRTLTPTDFQGGVDQRIQYWLETEGFETAAVQERSTQS